MIRNVYLASYDVRKSIKVHREEKTNNERNIKANSRYCVSKISAQCSVYYITL